MIDITQQLRTHMRKKTCYLIGEDHLLIQCGDVLLAKEYQINGICSPLEEAHIWAQQNGILCVPSYKDFEAHLLQKKFDYLFSIVNGRIISDKILKNVKKLAINYHDAPLPRYGGANATSFAIVNNEKQHGITWHIINELVDGGDILKQSMFDIDIEETTFSLNVKCYQHGLNTFVDLIEDLSQDIYEPQKQNLNHRLYYTLEKKPESNGWLAWDQPAEYIEKFARACSVGNYKNIFSTLKFILDGKAYIALEVKNSFKESQCAPGKITQISNDSFRVSTQTSDLIIFNIATIYGEKTPLEALRLAHNITINKQLSFPTNHSGLEFKDLSEKIHKHELFWVKQFQECSLSEFPFFEFPNTIPLKNKGNVVSKIKLTEKILQQIINVVSKNNLIDFFMTIWAVYIFRLNNEEKLSILINKNNKYYNEFISNDIPLNLVINKNQSFIEVFNMVKEKRAFLEKKEGFLKDIFFRYPQIQSKHQIPIVVMFDEDLNTPHINALIFRISLEKSELCWMIDENLINDMPNLLETTKNISHHFHNIIDALCANSSVHIKDIDLLSKSEKNKMLHTWNTTTKEYKGAHFIHQIISAMSVKTANKPAIVYDDTSITYRELDKKTNEVANYFIKNSFHQKHIIVYCDKSIDLVIAMLGIIKSGNIYVPISTMSPLNNIELIIKNSCAPIIITNTTFIGNLEKISSYSKLHILTVEDILLLENHTTRNAQKAITLEDNAYVLYTSGTTGTPKGVIIQHKGLVNLILYTIEKLKISSQTNLLQFASIGFDASILEILTSLSSGATLYIPKQEELLSGIALKNAITQHKISCIILPPSALQTISQYSLPTLKTVVTAGEYCSKELAEHWASKTHLINAYGPTEATVCVTMAVINNKILASPPIGKPISNTKVYVFDESFNCVPIGVVGELYISGIGLSPGYLHNKELTKQFFMPNPYEFEDILYRTRDLVRWLPSGELEYIGRIDNQVKIRGFRIELEAIETQLLHDPNIEQCAVVVQENQALGKYMVAFLKAKQNTFNINTIRENLKNHLPEYMIPSFFMALDAFPITQNGKIDRKKLPEFDPQIRTDFSSYKAPSNILEERLTDIWSELLKLSPIGIEDNFFELGGHSLIITNLSVYLQNEFNHVLSLQNFFQNPTICHLAKLIENKEERSQFKDDLSKDIVLPDEIRAQPKQNDTLHTIFLTGCTGFLGIHILYDLLKHNKYKIFCLVREKSKEEGHRRIQKEFMSYKLDINTLNNVHVICGDLSQPRLAILDDEFDRLAEEVDLICHNGAYVHHLYSYDMLKLSNVNSTVELLKLCTYKKNKTLHYISTLSAISDNHLNNNKVEEDFVDYSLELPKNMSGYNQSKLVSEYLLSQATNRGINVNIYRPGWIMGQHNTGIVAPENNHLLLLIKGCIQLGMAPQWDNFILTILPVDFVSEFIVQVMFKENIGNNIFNLTNNSLLIHWIEFVSFFNSNGYSINLVPIKTWHTALLKIKPDNAMYNLLALYNDEKSLHHQMYTLSSDICNNNTEEALTKINLNLNLIKEELLSRYLHFLRNHQFL